MNPFLPLIRAYSSIFQNPLMLIFTLLSVVQIYQGLRQLARVRGRWHEWVAEPLVAWKRQIGHVLSFYAAVPIGVLIHELGHALVVWAYGGRVVEFGYFFFWGYVLPDRQFVPASREWFLSLAGTLGSLFFAFMVATLFWRHQSASVRFAAKRTVRFQIYFSLIYYPIFTAILPIGDWRTIYDFAATPRLSAATAVVHVLMLAVFWWGSQHDWFDEVEEISAELRTQYTQLAASPDIADQIDAILLLQHNGQATEARRQARKLQKLNPTSADAQLLPGLLNGANLENPSNDLIQHAKRASNYTFIRPDFQAYANHVLGFDQWARGKTERAINFYDEAITAAQKSNATDNPVRALYALFYMRAIAHAALNHRAQMIADFEKAITLVEARKAPELAQRYREEMRLLLAKIDR